MAHFIFEMREKMGTTSINHDIKSSNLINTQIIAVTEEKEMGNQKEKKKVLNKGKKLFKFDESFAPTCEEES